MGTKNNPGDFDCYLNAEPDEPMFVLLARDPDAPMLVEMWARIRERVGTTNPLKIEEALQCADDMRVYQETLAAQDA